MKAKELIAILSEDPEREVMIALGSFRVDHIVRSQKSNYYDDLSKPAINSFVLYSSSYKVCEEKGIDY